jgi:transcriptional regulator with XRE-family HTH domain
MGRASRPKPIKLAEKLKQIRLSLNLSQTDMLIRLGYPTDKKEFRSVISAYELGKREPTLIDLLKYAKIAKILVEELIDDEITLILK